LPCIPAILNRSPKSPWDLTGYTHKRAPAYQQDAFIPSVVAELVSTGNLRSQPFAELRFNPLQYNPVSGEVRYYSRILIELQFNSVGQIDSLSKQGQADSLSYSGSEGMFEDSLSQLLLNYDQARLWRSQPPNRFRLKSPMHPRASLPTKSRSTRMVFTRSAMPLCNPLACPSTASTRVPSNFSTNRTKWLFMYRVKRMEILIPPIICSSMARRLTPGTPTPMYTGLPGKCQWSANGYPEWHPICSASVPADFLLHAALRPI